MSIIKTPPTDRDWWARPVEPLTLVSQMEMEARIEAVRAETADPICSACGSVATRIARRLCTTCRADLPLTAFYKNRRRTGGYEYACRDCTRIRNRERYDLNKRAAFRRIVRRSA